MSWHLIVHWLDDLRGMFGNATFAWNVVRGNIGAVPWQAAIFSPFVALLWPKVREWIRTFLHKHIVIPMQAHVSTSNDEVRVLLEEAHAKMDHIILHHPDIPDYVHKEKK